jgi:hypothetical protein
LTEEESKLKRINHKDGIGVQASFEGDLRRNGRNSERCRTKGERREENASNGK